jgi:hypothetical protein
MPAQTAAPCTAGSGSGYDPSTLGIAPREEAGSDMTPGYNDAVVVLDSVTPTEAA